MDSPTNTGAGVVKMTICLAGCEEAIFLLRDIPKVLLGKTYFDLHFNVIKNQISFIILYCQMNCQS